MKHLSIRLALACLPLVALPACSRGAQEPAPAVELATVHEMMVKHVDVEADEVWGVGNAAIGDHGGIDPAQMTDASWRDLAAGAERLSHSAKELATLEALRVTHDNVKIADEDIEFGHSAAEVQANIDAQPETFRQMADTLATHAADLHRAALAHDATRAGTLIDGLDPVCESCHLEFWYPSQKAILKELEATDPTLRQELEHVVS